MAGIGAVKSGRRRKLRVAWLLMLGCVVAGSLAPRGSALKHVLDGLNPSDKLYHVLAYFMLALLPALHERRLTVTLQAAAALAVGLLLEFGQSHFSDRPFDPGDLVANAAGVVAALVAAVWLRPRLALVPLCEGR